jgi:hypothetical protein
MVLSPLRMRIWLTQMSIFHFIDIYVNDFSIPIAALKQLPPAAQRCRNGVAGN